VAVELNRWDRLAQRYEKWGLSLNGFMGAIVWWLGPRRGELKTVLQELNGQRVKFRLSQNMLVGISGRLDTASIEGGTVTLHVDDGIINLRKSRERLVLLSEIRYVEHAGRSFGPF
jgi:hypothetical protein